MDALKTGRTGARAGSGEEMVPAPAVADEFNITRRTLGRWFVDPKLDFPQPTEINRRLYFPRSSIEKWKAARLRKSVSEAV